MVPRVIRTFKDSAIDVYLPNQSPNCVDVVRFFDEAFPLISQKIRELLQAWGPMYLSGLLETEMLKIGATDNEEKMDGFFRSGKISIDLTSDIDEILLVLCDSLFKEIETFEARGSGWGLYKVNGLVASFCRRNCASNITSGMSFIEMPKFVKDKKAVLNTQNWSDEKCFYYAVTSKVLYPHFRGNLKRPSTFYCPQAARLIADNFDFSCITTWPPTWKEIALFEKLNPRFVLSIFTIDTQHNTVVPYRLSKTLGQNLHADNFIDLLYVTEQNNSHFAFIPQLSRLLNRQTKDKHNKSVYCRYCFKSWRQSMVTEAQYSNHLNFCQIEKPFAYIQPAHKFLKFRNVFSATMVPFVLFYDIETFGAKYQFALRSPQVMSYTEKLSLQEPYLSAYYFYSMYEDVLPSHYQVFEGPECMRLFLESLGELVAQVEQALFTNHPLEMSENDRARALSISACQLCNVAFDTSVSRHFDHDHLKQPSDLNDNSNFRFVLCHRCNARLRTKYYYLPAIAHNATNFDLHFILRSLQLNGTANGLVKVLAQNSEKFITLTKYFGDCKTPVKFVDSYRFLPSSLDNLVAIQSNFRIVCKHFRNPAQFSHMRSKGVFPYEYVTSMEQLLETSLPPKSSFYSSLSKSAITDEDYARAQNVWAAFDCKNLMDYAKVYLKADVLLLTQCFVNFRMSSYSRYGLDACHYITGPSYFWDSMLKVTGNSFELMTDIEMLQFIQCSIRGGMVSGVTRHYQVKNPPCSTPAAMRCSDVNVNSPQQPTSVTRLEYLDAVNLYGYSQSLPVPYEGFLWMPNPSVTWVLDNLPNWKYDQPRGYLLQVDIQNNEQEWQDFTWDLPFLPYKEVVPGTSSKKLLLSQLPKKNYIIHYMNLKQAVQSGMKLLAVHRVLHFKQACLLKKWVDYNTCWRQQATNKFEQKLAKDAVNIVFGKSMEKIHKEIRVAVATTDAQFQDLVSQSVYKSHKIIHDNLALVFQRSLSATMDKIPYVGTCILESSKYRMYDFFYRVVIPLFGRENISLAYQDTDSLLIIINAGSDAEILDKFRSIDLDELDTSNYDLSFNFPSNGKNRLVPGKFKNEHPSPEFIEEFIALRSKMYSYKLGLSQTVAKKGKGIPGATLRLDVNFENYKDIVQNEHSRHHVEYVKMGAKDYHVSTFRQKKVGLSSRDDKRFIVPRNHPLYAKHQTLPWGHYLIDEICNDALT